MALRKVSFFGQGSTPLGGDPIARDYATDPRRLMAQQLMQTGSTTAPVQSIGEGIARALSGVAGGYFAGEARRDMQGKEAEQAKEVQSIIAALSPKQLPAGVQGPPQPGGIPAALAAASGATSPRAQALAQQLAVQQYQMQQDAAQAAAARRAGIEDYEAKLKLQQQYPKPTSASTPASLQEWAAFQSMSPEDQKQYLLMKRANPYLNLGDVMARPNPISGGVDDTIAVGVAPKTTIQDDRIVTAPAVPGAGRGGAQPQMMTGGGGLPQPVPSDAVPAQAPSGPSVQDLPPSPKEVREMQEAEEQKAGKEAQRGVYGDVVNTDIDRALKLIEGNEIFTTGAGATVLANVPGTAARDVRGLIDTVKANVGFDRLQQMRDQSPTGGALGQVSEFENRLLQATIGNLEQSQSAEQLKYNLQRVRDIYLDIIHGPGNRPSGKTDGAPQDNNGGVVDFNDLPD